MANMNTKRTTIGMNRMNPTTNHEGSTVHQLTALETLFSKTLGSFFGESTFYENRDAQSAFKELQDLVQAVSPNDKEYVLKIAELGRLGKMIDYPLQLLTIAYNDERFKGKNFLGPDGKNKLGYYTDVIVRRAKDVNTILASHITNYGVPYYNHKEGKNKEKTRLTKQMREGLGRKLASFDKYKLSKGLDKDSRISLADSIKLLHPGQFNKDMVGVYKDIIEGKLKLGGEKIQIQTALSKKGQQKDKTDNKDLTQALYKSNVYALMKNLVNLYKNGVFEDSAALKFACDKLRNKDEILRSKMLPFRFLSAMKELERLGNNRTVIALKEAVEDALDISIENVENIDGTTAILVDKSGSMDYPVSSMSSVAAMDIALVLGAIAYKKGFGDLFIFANSCEQITISRRTPVMEIVKVMEQKYVGGGTDLKTALNKVEAYAKSTNTQYDNLIILSDNDCYGYSNGVLTFGERYSSVKTADKHVDELIKKGIIKKVWINNLLGNNFAIVNTNSYRKNLITGFSEDFINIISVYNVLGGNKDIRKVIDMMLEKKRKTAKLDD